MPGAPDCAYSSTAWPIRWDFQHQHQRSNASNSLTPNFLPYFHCQNVKDHFSCLPHFLILNAKSKSGSRTDEICPRDRHFKFENNTSGRARLWDTALKFLCPGLFITSPDHLVKVNIYTPLPSPKIFNPSNHMTHRAIKEALNSFRSGF